MEVSDEQEEKVLLSKIVTLSGIFMEANWEHPEKAPLPILLILSGRVIEVNLGQ